AHDFRRVTTLAEVDALAEAWQALEERCGDPLTYFQSFDWCRNWIATFAGVDDSITLRIETVWHDDRLVAVWPLMVQVIGGIRVLQNLGAPHSQYSNLICDKGHLVELPVGELVGRIC